MSALAKLRYSGVFCFFVFFIASSIISLSSTAYGALSRQEFCAQSQIPGFFRQQISLPKNRLSFDNWAGGLMGKGVCWWHSLFQRAAIYLTHFHPDLPRPTPAEAQKLIRGISSGKHAVEIPGYDSIYEFSQDWEPEIKAELERWQKVDGFLKMKWISGLKGSASLPPDEMLAHMQNLTDQIRQDDDIHWILWQLKGAASHSSLVLDADNTGTEFRVTQLDNNYQDRITDLIYTMGETSIDTYAGTMVPYIGRNEDLKNFHAANQAYCQTTTSSPSVRPLSKWELDEIGEPNNDFN